MSKLKKTGVILPEKRTLMGKFTIYLPLIYRLSA